MEEIVFFNHEDRIIEVFSSENVSPKSLENQLLKIKKLGKEFHVNKVMIDTTKGKKIPSPVEIYGFMSKLPRDFSYAILADVSKDFFSDLEFAENVSVNRGIKVQLFTKKVEALDWLNHL